MTVALGDGVAALSALQAGSAGLVLTDLPSGETRADFDKKVDLTLFWGGVWHALKPSGVAAVFASSLAFAAEVRASAEQEYRYDIIWAKTLATGHLNARHRPLRAHEFILVFFRSAGTYEPQMSEGHGPIHRARRTSHGENYGRFVRATDSRAGATDRYPTSVLRFASVGTSSKQRRHPQQKPVPLLRWLVRTYSKSSDVVVDPFAGSGSTLEAAEAEGREALGWDSSPRFARSAVRGEPGKLAELQVPDKPPARAVGRLPHRPLAPGVPGA